MFYYKSITCSSLLCIKKITLSYLCEKVYARQEREYFGLRDFYSLVKMVYATVGTHKREPSQEDITYAVQRNFGGYFGDFKPAQVFLSAVYPAVNTKLFKPARELVMEAVRQEGGETRYILLLTKNNAALTIIQEQVCVESNFCC